MSEPPREMTVTDGDALIRTILASPADDAPRLVYADWLEEHGRSEEAEFIRVQVELARLGYDGGVHTDEQGRLVHMPPDLAEMWSRQLGLWNARRGWPDLPVEMVDWPAYPINTLGTRVRARRGFVERLSCRCDDFMAVAVELFSRQPVTHVRLLDLEPAWDRHRRKYVWHCATLTVPPAPAHWVPRPVWAILSECGAVMNETVDLADSNLSTACVHYGRDLAGLAQLPT